MASGKWIRLPNGRLVKQRPNKLELFLAENESLIPFRMGSIDFPMDDSTGSAGQRQQHYNTKNFDNRKLFGCEITVIGAGAVGGYISYFLGPAHPSLNTIDFKKVEFRHTQNGRTIYEPTMVGFRKVNALKQKLERDYPGTKTNIYFYNIAEIPDIELTAMFARSFVVVLAIDDPKQILRVSDLAYPLVELIQVGMQAGGRSGHIAISVPFYTPCLRCTLGIDGPENIHQLHSESANSWDIMTVAQQAARIAIDIMYSKATGQHITRWDTSKNLIYIANTRQELCPDGPGLLFESSQKSRPGCSICNI